ncbi:androgen-induced gene 1 protein-like isoform X3 [Neodiprion virginianus]|uniref:androgen-induced gene 1 protein-like isoform X3 n=1 Tax=Neodiprion virginianus TaxID=2961670 RepID=UPI001EE6A666|nr:androgen-induced gene 1 protein-like isoform X3 [Neodiprion virginianus]
MRREAAAECVKRKDHAILRIHVPCPTPVEARVRSLRSGLSCSSTFPFSHPSSLSLYVHTFSAELAIVSSRAPCESLSSWILQAVFFFVCLLNDFGGSNELSPAKRPILRRVKDFIHASFGFPVAMFVGVTFWALMFVDRELVLPAAVDPYFPWWLNHLMHTLIMVTTVLEMIVAPRQYPKRLSGLGGLLIFMASYLVWLLIIYAKSEIWVYPVMEVLSWPQRIGFFVVLFLFTAILYILGEYLDRLIWGRAKKSVGKSAKKKKSK